MAGFPKKGLLRLLMMTMARILFVCLLCLAAKCALAGEPGKELKMNDISGILREAEGQAKKLPPPANNQATAGENAAGALIKQFNAPSYQAMIREEQQRLRETVFKDVIGEAMPTDGTQTQVQASTNIGERLYLFVSSSVPLATLRNYASMIDRAKASQVTMVLRGFVGGMNKAGPTMAFIGEILKKDPACDLNKGRCDSYQVNIQIDPERFQRFRIEEVPALAYLTASDDEQTPDDPLIITGDASLDALLERINGEAKSPSLQTMIAALRGGVNHGECQ
ncbi:MAG: type-F conjugative transfer system pilin assembly protein TrbC [Desulfobulbaceae bacterium]|nr:type-F conjugative transfer system pilin assembly protein TrbC [Desulfobulbaceae bacterium]